MLFFHNPNKFMEGLDSSSRIVRFGIGNSPIFFCERRIIVVNKNSGEIERESYL